MNRFTYLLLPLLILAACSKDPSLQLVDRGPDPADKSEINEFVLDKLQEFEEFRWSMADDRLVWSAAVQSDSVVGIGYQPAGFVDLEGRIHEIDFTQPAWEKERRDLIDFIVAETNRLHPGEDYTEEDLLVDPRPVEFPSFEVRIFDQEIISALRDRNNVRFVEPMSYTMEEVTQRSSAGCSEAPSSNVNSADYTTTSPSAKIPWNFYNANIPSAWNTSKGAGITIALIDTGTYPQQSKLNGSFASGQSTGRYILREGTYDSSWWPWWTSPDGPNDKCGHGTQMAGLLAAPRASGGSSVGVAYKSNLYSLRGTGDVVVNGWKEKRGVRDALKKAGKRSDVKVISMSIGDIFYSSTVADGIFYAYNKGKMIFAAAGTSTSFTNWVGVVFPATMSQTVAVTGVKDGSSLQKCNTCHSGSAVDFVAVMQRSSNNSRTSLTLAKSGNTPGYVGGSSAATATTAGIAALVWATNPSQSRNQVLNRLKNASSIYPSRNSQYGWGTIDAADAVN